ncbi:MAG: hypothetical protein K0Q55_1034 [Verrucomicrobia bacterium]|nr:hypothetical protein [Verrucomicrobiota bacterium]
MPSFFARGDGGAASLIVKRNGMENEPPFFSMERKAAWRIMLTTSVEESRVCSEIRLTTSSSSA